MNENQHLGERAMRTAMVITKNDVEVYYLEKEDF